MDDFATNANESVDTDNDGTGNNADTDDDKDGVADGSDALPLNANESVDTDNDGNADITNFSGLAPDLGAVEYGTVVGCLDENACNYNPEPT